MVACLKRSCWWSMPPKPIIARRPFFTSTSLRRASEVGFLPKLPTPPRLSAEEEPNATHWNYPDLPTQHDVPTHSFISLQSSTVGSKPALYPGNAYNEERKKNTRDLAPSWARRNFWHVLRKRFVVKKDEVRRGGCGTQGGRIRSRQHRGHPRTCRLQVRNSQSDYTRSAINPVTNGCRLEAASQIPSAQPSIS